MTPQQIENWAGDLIARAKAGQSAEDTRAELKMTWIDARPAARQITGLCNSALGQPAIWVVGVNEKTGEIVGAEAKELARWWPAVERCIDGTAPEMQTYNLRFEQKPVTVLYFETD